MTQRHGSRALKSERPWGKPTCPLNPIQRMRERAFQNGVKGGDRSWGSQDPAREARESPAGPVTRLTLKNSPS